MTVLALGLFMLWQRNLLEFDLRGGSGRRNQLIDVIITVCSNRNEFLSNLDAQTTIRMSAASLRLTETVKIVGLHCS
jgi:hypothetical protein